MQGVQNALRASVSPSGFFANAEIQTRNITLTLMSPQKGEDRDNINHAHGTARIELCAICRR